MPGSIKQQYLKVKGNLKKPVSPKPWNCWWRVGRTNFKGAATSQRQFWNTVNEYAWNLVLWCLCSFWYLGSLFTASLIMSVLYRSLWYSCILTLVDLAPFSPLEFAVGCAFLPLNQAAWIHKPKEKEAHCYYCKDDSRPGEKNYC